MLRTPVVFCLIINKNNMNSMKWVSVIAEELEALNFPTDMDIEIEDLISIILNLNKKQNGRIYSGGSYTLGKANNRKRNLQETSRVV